MQAKARSERSERAFCFVPPQRAIACFIASFFLVHQRENAMITTKEEGGLAVKLAAPAANVLDQQRDAVCKLLGGGSGGARQDSCRIN